MEKLIFVVNIGSASKKYALYNQVGCLVNYHFEKEKDSFVLTVKVLGITESISASGEQFKNAASFVLDNLVKRGILKDVVDINAIGFRLVAPGSFFATNRSVDSEFLEQLKVHQDEDSLHMTPMIEEIDQLSILLKNIPILAVSDSAFHASMPERSANYAISKQARIEFDIKRFGYHGISLSSIVKKIEVQLESMPEKVVICHLGSGASITALKDGKSVDTSMGLTPLEGLVMASRAGDIDAGAVIGLQKKSGMNLSQLEEYFYTECGLKGVSNKTGDIRELLELEKAGDKDASLALEMFVYRIKKYIGAYAAALNGIDLLVFSATIGERSFIIRERICSDLESLGLVIDKQKNNQLESREGLFSTSNSKIKAAVILTDEAGEIVEEVRGMDYY